MVKENIYGHLKRLHWIVSHLSKEDRIVEVGCGTGIMITLPLFEIGYQVMGIDTDEKSIDFGQDVCRERGMDPGILKLTDLASINTPLDVLIVSEVLEHLSQNDLFAVMNDIRNALRPGGKLLVTVPNGYGWFELESLLWFRAGIGYLLDLFRVGSIINVFKCVLLGCGYEPPYPSTLSDSFHVHRFTYNSIRTLLETHGFQLTEMTGSVLFAGPFSNLFFTGIKSAMKLNCMIGGWVPKLASGFYVACRLGKSKIVDDK